jgi:uncharacterized protein with PQ loop repeat
MITKEIIEYGALIFGTISAIAYLPQIRVLLKEKDSTGDSPTAWILWFICDIPPLIYAIYIKDLVFTVLYSLSGTFLLIATILIIRYRKK